MGETSRGICRICLTANTNMFDLFTSAEPKEVSLVHMLTSCASIEVNSSDSLPGLICAPCIKTLTVSYNFKKQCERSDKLLRGGIHNKSLKVEEVIEEDLEEAPDEMAEAKWIDADLNKNASVNRGKEGPFTCPLWDKSFMKQGNLKLHLETHTDRNICKHCELKCESYKDLINHSRQQHRLFKCQMCEKSFSMENALNGHMHYHKKQIKPDDNVEYICVINETDEYKYKASEIDHKDDKDEEITTQVIEGECFMWFQPHQVFNSVLSGGEDGLQHRNCLGHVRHGAVRRRPPGIYKADYLEELYRRYEDVLPPPKLPPWCFEESEGDSQLDNGVHTQESDKSTSSLSSSKKAHRRKTGKVALFMDGVPGVEVFTEQPKAHQLQKKVQAMCEWRSKDFPGCQPVFMDKENIKLLHQKPYRVSWKAGSTRYMMLIDGEDKVYFFDRDHNIFKVNGLSFLYRKDLKRHLKDTLIDGEMVIDKVNGVDIPRYLAYDIVKFEGQDVGKTTFYPTRLQCIANEIIRPRHQAMEAGFINRALEPFSVRKKDFWDITQAGSLLGEKFAASLLHEPNGLIFQPSKEPYVAGRLKVVKKEGEGIVAKKVGQLYVGQLVAPFGIMRYTKALKDLDGKVIECKYEDNQWKFMRERTDKSYPNGYKTAKAVFASIKDPVTKEYLLDFIEKYKFDDDSKIMPPPAKPIRR